MRFTREDPRTVHWTDARACPVNARALNSKRSFIVDQRTAATRK